jgi:DNA-binding transcriptional LysR family regulator
MRQTHPLVDVNLTLKRYLSAQHLMVNSSESPYDRINLDLEKAGVLQQVKFSVPHFTAVPYIIANSDLLVTVPQKLAESTALPFRLTCRPAPLVLPELQTNIFWHRRYNQDQGNLWLRTLIGSIFGE